MLKHPRQLLGVLGATGTLFLSAGAATATAAGEGGRVQPANSNCPNCIFSIPDFNNFVGCPDGFAPVCVPGVKSEVCGFNGPGGGGSFTESSQGVYDVALNNFYADTPGDICPAYSF